MIAARPGSPERERRVDGWHAYQPRSSWRSALALLLAALPAIATAEVTVEKHDDRIDVAIDGKPYTSYVFAGHRKPILFPVLGHGGVAMTRSWPMVEGVAGEPHDHPHHESIWFTHGNVNGVDFWASHPAAKKPELRADNRIEHATLVKAEGGREGVIETKNRWMKADGTQVCSDTRRLVFGGEGTSRTIDYSITIHADHGPVTFGDTKEGAMGLRVPVQLQLTNVDGSKGAAGHCINSEGHADADVWGKAARWVAYWGPIEGRTVGLAILDHPDNLRHPTHWHARDYGLVAANPFGLHDFTGAAKGTGDYTIPAGDSLTLRYLIVVHEGDSAAADIDALWKKWTHDDRTSGEKVESHTQAAP
ncbi:MAG: PmoA family protein [Planctomycetia bacterium]|nr:PmoA family protein [Planctomycetia bacterium]